jgi:uncharacterized protein (TIGR03435 family)
MRAGSLTFAGVILLACLSSGCREKKSAESADIPEKVRNLPFNTELSDVPGVSIIQREAEAFESYSMSQGLDTAEAKGVHLNQLLLEWVEFSGWIFVDAEIPDRRYDVSVEAPEGTTNLEQLRKAFESVFGLEFVEKSEPMEVWVLERAEESPRGLEPVGGQHNWGTAQTPGGFGYEFRPGSMEDLVGILGKYLEGGVVLDETGLEGSYKFVLSMDHWDPSTAAPAVEKLGLRVVKAEREMTVMRIDYTESPVP